MNTVPRLCQRKQNRGVSDNVNHLVAGEVGHLAVDPGGLAQGHRHHAAVGARVQEVGAGLGAASDRGLVNSSQKLRLKPG